MATRVPEPAGAAQDRSIRPDWPGRGRVPRRQPVVPRDRRPRRAARDRVRAPRRARRRLPRLHRRQPVRGVAARGAPAACCARPSTATRTRSTRPRRPRPCSWSGRAPPCCATSTRAESEYACIFTPNATGALRLVGEAYPFGPQDRVPGDVRQPQLGQRHPRVRPREGRADGVRAARGARPARRRRAARALPRRGRAADGHNLFAYPGAVELLRRQAPARVDRARPGARLGRDRRLRRVRADQPARPVGVEAGLRPDLVLQDVRLPDRARRAARAAPGARAAAAPVVQRRHRGRREHPGRAGRAAVRPRAVRGRHRQLPRHPGGRDRPAPHRADRHRHDLAARRGARDVAARGAAAAAALGRQPGDPRLRADDVGPPRGARSPSTSCTRTAAWSTSASSTSSRRRTASPSAPGCFCNSGAGETAFSLSQRHADRRRVRRRDDPRRLHPARSACRRAARCASRSGSRRTSPTSTASCASRRSSATSPRCPADLPPRLAC